jgi:hypothetical protein
MCEYLKSLCEASRIKILKIEMSEFGLWILKVENWKLNFEISLWNVWKESKVLKTKMSKYWKLKIEMFEYWKLKTKMFEY